MSATSLERKTVRPGSLLGYSYYHSSRRPARGGKAVVPLRRHSSLLRRRGTLLMLLVAAVLGITLWRSQAAPTKPAATLQTAPAKHTAATAPKAAPQKTAPAATAPAAAPPTNYCAGNQAGQLLLVSISQRHLWACQAAQTVYDSPVVTGINYLAADQTPVGTYHIYGKYTDTYLKGRDSTGSWDDYVYYWMPFLQNQYGSYGFHDATWRSDSAFGNISPNSSDASHGCVELPLATAKWLYGWVGVGATVTIED